MANLRETTQRLIEIRMASLAEAQAALEIIDRLPSEIQQLSGIADTGWADSALRLDFWRYDNSAVDVIKVLKMAGVQGLAVKMDLPDFWSAKGEFILDGEKVKVVVNGLPRPSACRIEEYEEVVKKYRAICTETGEEIK